MTEPVRRPSGGTGLNKRISGIALKWWLLGGTVAAGTVWYVYKRQQASAAATAAQDAAAAQDQYGAASDALGGAYASNYGTPSNYGYYDQATGAFIPVGSQQATGIIGIPTNSAWFQQAQAYLVQLGYDPMTVAAALGKYLAGAALTQTELDIARAAIGAEGQPPSPVPAPHLIPPQGQTGGTGGTGGTTTRTQYAVQIHQITVATGARALVQRFSNPKASATAIEIALRATVADPRNARYLVYYASHRGMFPAQAKIYLTVVR